MAEGKIIAVWGSPNSGKTTFATKLATSIYSSFESTVITLFCDLETPVLPVLFPFYKPEELGSVGVPLSKTEVEQGDIISNLVTVKNMQNFGFIGYKTGENKYSYPKFGRAKAEDLLGFFLKGDALGLFGFARHQKVEAGRNAIVEGACDEFGLADASTTCNNSKTSRFA